MKYFLTLALALNIAACAKTDRANETIKSDTETITSVDKDLAGMPGSDRTPEGCIPSAGYQWSKAMEECVRIWEVGTELVHQGSGDPEYSAWAIHTDSKAEIIIRHDNQHVLLNKIKGRNFMWQNEEADLVLLAGGDGALELQDMNGFVMYRQDISDNGLGYDEIPDHSYDEAGGEIVAALGIVSKVEDGAYPQFTLHIELKDEPSDTVFNLIAEGAELNGADLHALEGVTVSIEYVIKETNELMRIAPKGEIKFEEIEEAGDWFLAEGLLEGAEAVSVGDLPDVVTIWVNGGKVTFETFIDEDLVALNGQEVSALLFPDTVNDIQWLKVVD